MKQIQPEELARLLAAGEEWTLLDVREREEWEYCRLPDALWKPLSELTTWDEDAAELPERLVVYCHHGVRSAQVCARLRALGHPGPVNLAGGIDRWSRAVDPELPRY